MLARPEVSLARWSKNASATFALSRSVRAPAAKLAFWILAAGLCATVGIAALTQRASETRKTRAPAAAAPHPARAIPAGAQAVASETIGRDDPIFWALRDGRELRAQNRAQRFSSRFTPAGAIVSTASAHVSLTLREYGRAGALRTVSSTVPTARANRIVYAHGALKEWYVNGPLGLEQGFTLDHRPLAGHGPLVLSLGTTGALATRRSRSGVVFQSAAGKTVLRYGALSARDARGHVLPASLGVHNHGLRLQVDDAGAVYPLTIDPKLTNPQKFVPKGENGDADFGAAMALSGDGNTVLVGGPDDNPQPGGGPGTLPDGKGAVWAFTRSGTTWKQLGKKLTGKGESGYGDFGSAVGLTRNGKTALIGGQNDLASATRPPEGAIWVFKRSGSKFKQQGKKLAPNPKSDDGVGGSIALTPNGKTALIGAPNYASGSGTAFIYVRSGSKYKLKSQLLPSGPGVCLAACFDDIGQSVGLSSDGKTALVEAPGTSLGPHGSGEAFVFTRSGSAYKQAATLAANDAAGESGFGNSVALSADGKSALLAGPYDNKAAGAAWFFNRSGSKWTQDGKKLLSGEHEKGDQTGFGSGVAMNPSGSTFLVGASFDEGNVGAVWLYTRSGAKLTRSNETGIGKEKGERLFGDSAAISADGHTALIGAPLDHPGKPIGPNHFEVGVGALWEFTVVP